MPNPTIKRDGKPVAFHYDDMLNDNWASAPKAFFEYRRNPLSSRLHSPQKGLFLSRRGLGMGGKGIWV